VQVTQHGACLGLGLAALGTEDEVVFEEIKNVLYTDSAVAGEAAGIALGLVNVGSANEKASELLTYAHDTQHEKVRPANLSLAFPVSLSIAKLLDSFSLKVGHADVRLECCVTAQIIRGVALGLALMMYGQEEGAETLIEDMTRDQDPILR
jgi:26S proteasome regulatory subunit N2